MIIYYIYKLIYQKYDQEINKLYEDKIISKFHLRSYSNYNLLEKEKERPNQFKDILFIGACDGENEEFKIYSK